MHRNEVLIILLKLGICQLTIVYSIPQYLVELELWTHGDHFGGSR